MPSSRRVAASYLAVALSLTLGACGGGSSSSTETTPPPPSVTVTSVSASCNSATVPVGQTIQCGATVHGTGTFNSSVAWSVNNVPGGNPTVGTTDETGLYKAAAVVPTPFTVTISAASSVDATKSGSVPVVIGCNVVGYTGDYCGWRGHNHSPGWEHRNHCTWSLDG